MGRAVGLRGTRRQSGLSVSPREETSPLRKTREALGIFAALHRRRMDITWLTDRIAVGGGIWTADNMAQIARLRVTHIIDMQIEFDDTPLAQPHDIEVLWNPTDDDFDSKPPELFRRGVDFGLKALENPETRLFIHCAAGVHRA